jgi:hypothetical protein
MVGEASPGSGSQAGAGKASEFMLKEYEQIVQAFFESGKEKTTLFNYYITLITAPITLIAAIFGILTIQENVDLSKLQIENLPNFVGFTVMIIAVSGFLMSIIISDTRMDAILYARVLNQVRRYFVDHHAVPKEYLFLPIRIDVPQYNEIKNFRALGAELIFMAALDSALFLFAYAIIFRTPIDFSNMDHGLASSSVGFFVAHLAFYWLYAWHRQRSDEKKSASKETKLPESRPKMDSNDGSNRDKKENL